MNVLIIGSGKGSWEMRGVQLGRALGARVATDVSATDLAWASVVVLVKRAIVTAGPRVRDAGKPIVWDALDFWSQPAQNALDQRAALALLRDQVALVRPAVVIGATEAMARDCGGPCLPHHGYLDLSPTEARREVRTVGYDGNPLYIETWTAVLRQACARRGWRFIMNPPDLSRVDILVSLRGGRWDGWICREWKSGVKIGNAVLAGRPIITQGCAAARELPHVGSIVETPSELDDALGAWSGWLARQDAVERCRALAQAYRLDTVAGRYRLILQSVAEGVPCC